MDRLWAPWRMPYLLGEHKPAGCIFCALPARDCARADLVLRVEDHAFACLNRYPFTPGHLMVIARRHVADLSELSDAEASALFALVRNSVAAVRAATRCEGVNVGMNLGAAAGAGIADHLHVHVVPRWGGDTNFMPVVADLRVMPEYLDQAWERLAPHFVALGPGKGVVVSSDPDAGLHGAKR